jgi:integrase/recombinase XerD
VNKHLPKPRQNILRRYQQHLREVAGFSPSTTKNHSRDIAHFLEAASIKKIADLAKLRPVDLTGYMTERSTAYQPGSLRQVAGSLRGFLQFAQQQGWIAGQLSLAVPSIACPVKNDLPIHLSREQLRLLLASWDRRTAQGRRDLAIGLCLARLGMRASEVAQLRLEDLDWRQGVLRVNQAKNGQAGQLPLLAQVGESIAKYLHAGRPVCSHRQVFLFHQSVRPMTRQAVSDVIRRALRCCGIQVPRPGAHLLRHTIASHLVQSGASLKEVADLLRHRHLNSAAVYAHVDLVQLRTVAQPWPKEAVL